MSMKKLYIFVEGNDDQMFFSSVFAPQFRKIYDDVEIIQYAQLKKSKVDLFLLSIKTLKFDYMMIADIDAAETIGTKKRFIRHKFEMVDLENIVVVITEIESWFLAGITEEFSNKFELDSIEKTDEITKEDFNQYYIRTYKSRIDFMQEVLKHYSIEAACRKNKSFNFFFQKYLYNRN